MNRPRQGEAIVICPKCGARCKARRSEPRFTRYYCTSTDCNHSEKKNRPQLPDNGSSAFQSPSGVLV